MACSCLDGEDVGGSGLPVTDWMGDVDRFVDRLVAAEEEEEEVLVMLVLEDK